MSIIKNNAVPIAAGAGALAGLIVGAGTGVAIGKRKSKSSRKSKKRTVRSKRTSKGRKTPRTAGKGKDRSTKRIRYTKNGQPYVIMKSGKAKFIKKNSAKRSHRTKGGRY